MTEAAVQKRLEALMETDWRSAAAVLLQEREEAVRAGKESYVRKGVPSLIIDI